jgi:hypothetical protein
MQGWSRDRAPAPRRHRSAEDVLNGVERRARERLSTRARGLCEVASAALGECRAIRRHPWASAAIAALLGVIATPVIVRALGRRAPALRRVRSLAVLFGLRAPFGLAVEIARSRTKSGRKES